MKTCKKTKRKIILYIKKAQDTKHSIIYKKSFEKLLVDLIINIFKNFFRKNPRNYLSIK